MKLYAQHTIHRGTEVIPARTVFDGTQAELDQFETMNKSFPAARAATEEEIAIARYEAETANGGRPVDEPKTEKPAKTGKAGKAAKTETSVEEPKAPEGGESTEGAAAEDDVI